MPQAISILFGGAFTAAVCWAMGRLLLRGLSVRLYREEEHVIGFVAGAACLSLIVFLLCAVHAARPGVFLAVGVAIILKGARRASGKPLPPLPVFWKWVFRSTFAVYSVVYFIHAMAPEMSPDGMTYHLGVVSIFLRAHGFTRITTNMYANLSEGVEMLFLFAYAFGRH